MPSSSVLLSGESRKQTALTPAWWGVALLKLAQLVPPQVYDALSIGNGDHRPWSIEKHHIRSAQERPSSHATCFVFSFRKEQSIL